MGADGGMEGHVFVGSGSSGGGRAAKGGYGGCGSILVVSEMSHRDTGCVTFVLSSFSSIVVVAFVVGVFWAGLLAPPPVAVAAAKVILVVFFALILSTLPAVEQALEEVRRRRLGQTNAGPVAAPRGGALCGGDALRLLGQGRDLRGPGGQRCCCARGRERGGDELARNVGWGGGHRGCPVGPPQLAEGGHHLGFCPFRSLQQK